MKKSFTLIELVLVIAIMSVLVATMIPIINETRKDAQVSDILRLTDSLKLACRQYYSDTGTYAIETSGAPPSNPFAHGLAMDDGKAGWNGPYINQPMSQDDSPYNYVIIVGLLTVPWIQFDLDGDGTIDRTVGNNLQIWTVPQNDAKRINDHFDSHLGDGNWENTGKVERRIPNVVDIYLIGC